MPQKIRVLHEDLVNRIAAGEVVERPASVVKELVENAIDAGSGRISIHVDRGGMTSIRIIDNGHGMCPEDARLAFERHATSKIASEEDLNRIRTLGFRGEALSSIASVSYVVLQTKERGRVSGTRVEISGGKFLSVTEKGCPEGTDIQVSDLFHHVPARKKFLKSVSTEFGHILGSVTQFGLAYPEVHFQLTHNGRTQLDLPPVKTWVDRVSQIYGEEIVPHLIDLSWRSEDFEAAGLISSPAVAYPDRGYQEFFVNGRAIRNVSLSHAVGHAYQDLIPSGRFPAVFLFLRLSPEEVDVNVHPTKREVRFRNQSKIHDGLVAAVRESLKSGVGYRVPDIEEARSPAGPGYEEGRVQEGTPFHYGVGPNLSPVPETRYGTPPLFHHIRILGQIRRLYILAEVDDELQMIDQHAAHERILYDRLKAQHRDGALEVQRLLFPERFELSPREIQTLEEIAGLLKDLGFEMEAFGGRTFILSAVPALLGTADHPRLIREILSDWEQSDRKPEMKELLIEMTGRRACRQAIRGGMSMDEEAMRRLLVQLSETEMPYTCPHGRPVVWKISLEEIEKRFGRRA